MQLYAESMKELSKRLKTESAPCGTPTDTQRLCGQCCAALTEIRSLLTAPGGICPESCFVQTERIIRLLSEIGKAPMDRV